MRKKIGKPLGKSGKMKRPAVFLDRDGTLMRDLGYLSDARKIHLFKGAVPALKLLKKAGYRILVVTNQSGVARGYFPQKAVRAVHRRLQELLGRRGARVDAFFYCPHYPDGKVESLSMRCTCRKPRPGMVRMAASRYPLDLRRSWMVGDKLEDLKLARNAGFEGAFLVLTGNGRRVLRSLPSGSFFRDRTARDVLGAVRGILDRTSGRTR
jgi:D-glycero-D-manno-heptose 1,7-bisphosphate phosphatase